MVQDASIKLYHVVYYCNMYYIVITYSIIAVLMISYAAI